MAWWKDQGKEREFTRPPYTANDIMLRYVLQEKPLEGRTMYQLLEPLAGTSFMEKALRELRLHFGRARRKQPHTDVYPYDLFHFWLGDNYPDQVQEVTDAQRLDEATFAIRSHSTHAIGIDRVYVLHWLKDPSEMLLGQGRWDTIYHDNERTEKAFNHHAGQWQFYKGGKYLHTIAESRIDDDDYDSNAGRFRGRSILPEGSHQTTFFIDARSKPFPALSFDQQQFIRGYRILSISPRFSYEKARSK